MSTDQKAWLAGGCFWGMQELLRKHRGVLKTTVGYTGGIGVNITYDTIKSGGTGHTEAIEVIFDSEQLSYRELLALFFQIHDPTTPNQQGNDYGSQYRSAIFYLNEDQKNVALQTIKDVDATKLWPGEIVTQVNMATEFWPAEKEHQDYLQRNPMGYSCHFPRAGWKLPNK